MVERVGDAAQRDARLTGYVGDGDGGLARHGLLLKDVRHHPKLYRFNPDMCGFKNQYHCYGIATSRL